MSKGILGTVIAFSLAVGLAAQTKQEQKTTTGGTNKTITITGCLQNGSQPNTFLLTKVQDPLTETVAIATSGSIPTVTYQLIGGTDLKSHVGQKLEVTGDTKLGAKQDVATESKSSAKETPAPSAAKGGKAPTPTVETTEKVKVEVRTLTVKSFKMLSTTCS
jgi:hypothetical protein